MRLIDADKLDQFLENAEIEAHHKRKYVLEGAINTLHGNIRTFPAIEPERKTGKWVGIKEYCDYLNEKAEREGKGNRYMLSGMNIHVYCNQCWWANDGRTKFCPDCGVRMVQEGEGHDKG